MSNFSIYLYDKKILFKFGRILSKIIFSNITIFLIGGVGVGKTALTKGLIGRLCNYKSDIKSPTYSLVETYVLTKFFVHHFDFYRFVQISDLHDFDIKSYLDGNTLLIVEWGDKFFCMYFSPHICIHFFYYSDFFNRFLFLKSNYFDFNKLFR